MVKMDTQNNHLSAVSHYAQPRLSCQSGSPYLLAVVCVGGFFQVDASLFLRVACALIIELLPRMLFYLFFKIIKQH